MQPMPHRVSLIPCAAPLYGTHAAYPKKGQIEGRIGSVYRPYSGSHAAQDARHRKQTVEYRRNSPPLLASSIIVEGLVCDARSRGPVRVEYELGAGLQYLTSNGILAVALP